jgi:hypothetical protein
MESREIFYHIRKTNVAEKKEPAKIKTLSFKGGPLTDLFNSIINRTNKLAELRSELGIEEAELKKEQGTSRTPLPSGGTK